MQRHYFMKYLKYEKKMFSDVTSSLNGATRFRSLNFSSNNNHCILQRSNQLQRYQERWKNLAMKHFLENYRSSTNNDYFMLIQKL